MKALKIILGFSGALVLCVAFGAWSMRHYSHQCTKCLTSKSATEHRLFGIMLTHREGAGDPPAPYARIFGHPCEHIFRGGFRKRSISLLDATIRCGPTREESFLRPRTQALYATYDAEHRLADRALTLETFQLIDRLMPPDTQIKQDPDLPQKSHESLLLLAHYLPRANTVDQWRAILDSARNDFVDTSQLPAE